MRDQTAYTRTRIASLGVGFNLLQISEEPGVTSPSDVLYNVSCVGQETVLTTNLREKVFHISSGGTVVVNLQTGWVRFHGTGDAGTVIFRFNRRDDNRNRGVETYTMADDPSPAEKSMIAIYKKILHQFKPTPVGVIADPPKLTLQDLSNIAKGNRSFLKRYFFRTTNESDMGRGKSLAREEQQR